MKKNRPIHSLFYFFLICSTLFSQALYADCNNDTIPPNVIAPADLNFVCSVVDQSLDYTDTLVLQQLYGNATASDNCQVWTRELPPNVNLTTCITGTITRKFYAIDASGNISALAQQVISVDPSSFYTIHIPGDALPNGQPVDTFAYTIDSCSSIHFTWADIQVNLDCDPFIEQTLRTFTVVNWCNPQDLVELPSLDIDGDGITGDAYEIEVRNDSLFLMEASGPNYFGQTGILQYTQVIQYENPQDIIEVQGQVYNDLNESCGLDMSELGLAGWEVQLNGLVTGSSFQTVTDSLGNYYFISCPEDTVFEVQLLYPFNYAGACPTTFSYELATNEVSVNLDLPVQLSDCPIMGIDLSAISLRPCFENIYHIQYQNYSTQDIPATYAQIVLDPNMTFVESSIANLPLMGDTLIFPIGDLLTATSGSFTMTVFLDCEVEVGQTHCVEARIFPDSICPPPSSNWSGASVALQSECDGDSIRFLIKNIGDGNMQAERTYIVIEDVLMREDGNFQLPSGSDQPLSFPANGATWHLSAEQVDFHPGLDMPMLTIEGCGGVNNPGQAMSFPQNDADLFVSIDCQQNVAAYDPNDKQVMPQGTGPAHILEANTDLSYKIRFQNTGTAPAIKVVVVDTLSPLLDATSIQTGASSHAFTFERIGAGNILRFTFDNIMLPDSNANEAASHGFVKFRIKQKPNNPIGSVINNSAAIYFDFNDPILTNTTFITIGEVIYEVSTHSDQLFIPDAKVQLFPNPTQDLVSIQLKNTSVEEGQVQVINNQGQLMKLIDFSGSETRFDTRPLAAGVYLLRILVDGEQLGAHRLMVY